MSVVPLRTEDVPLADLTPFPGNPRRGNVEAIRASLRRLGQYRALVVRQLPGSLVILAGNHTAQALALEGATTARCEFIECDDDEARRINAADNRLGELGGYDDELLAALLLTFDGDLDGTGYADEDLAALLTPPDPPGDADEPFAELPPAVTQPGQLWQVGVHRLICGDARDPETLKALCDGVPCDAMWTDPPYGVDYVGLANPAEAKRLHRRADGLRVPGDQKADLPGLLGDVFEAAGTVLKPGAALYICHAPGPDGALTWAAARDAGWNHRQNLVWVKQAIVLGHADYHYAHEMLWYGYTAGPGRMGRGGKGWFGDHSQSSVFAIKGPRSGYHASDEHPTMKPVELITRCLVNSCKPRGVVLDPFAGSGSTGVAAAITGHKSRLAEIDPRYCDATLKRLAVQCGTEPELIAGP